MGLLPLDPATLAISMNRNVNGPTSRILRSTIAPPRRPFGNERLFPRRSHQSGRSWQGLSKEAFMHVNKALAILALVLLGTLPQRIRADRHRHNRWAGSRPSEIGGPRRNGHGQERQHRPDADGRHQRRTDRSISNRCRPDPTMSRRNFRDSPSRSTRAFLSRSDSRRSWISA